MRALAILIFLATAASADVEVAVVSVRDPEGKVDFIAVRAAIDALKEPATGWCSAKADMLAWVVLDAGKITVDTGGSGDRKAELCIAKLLRRIKLTTNKRVVAVLHVDATPFANDPDDVFVKPHPRPKGGGASR